MQIPRLIALDLDGTLLPESKRISPRSLAALRKMRELGTEVTIATGKFLHISLDYARELELTKPIVALDGARIADSARREGANQADGLDEVGIGYESAIEVLTELVEPDWDIFLDDGQDDLLLRSRNPVLARIARVWADRVHEVDDLLPSIKGEPGVMVIYGPQAELFAAGDEIGRRFPNMRISRFRSKVLDLARLTLQPEGTSKGSGLLSVLERFGIAPDECMVFGDWHNDLPMFEIGAVGVAMANAEPEIKAAATHVTRETCENDGVAAFLEEAFL